MKYIIVFLFALTIPMYVHAGVYITEIAWMGTASSQYSEWIELYNDGSSSVDLAGWKLYEGDGGTLVFTFTKPISAQGYLLLERTTPSAPDAIPGVNDEAGPFGGGGLANTGEDLVLKDVNGALVEELNYLSGWPAGDGITKKTMQQDGGEWITATATPKASVQGVGDTGSEDEEVVSEEAIAEAEPLPKTSPNKPRIEFTIPPTVYKGISYQYSAQPVLEYNYRVTTGSMYWNFGDGVTLRQEVLEPVSHIYEYPGTYTLSFLYTDPANSNAPLKGTKKIVVTSPGVSVRVIDGKAFEIRNTSSSEIDLSGWKISTPGRAVTIPDLTVIGEKATAMIPFAALGMSTGAVTAAVLIDPSGSVVATSASTQQHVAPSGSTVVAADQPMIEPDTLVASAIQSDTHSSIRNRTRTIIVGAVALFVIGLSILLERVMARREYQEE